MDKGTPQTHPPDKYCAKCGGMRMRVKQLESQLTEVKAERDALVEAARALINSALWIPESDRRVVGHDEFYTLAALIDTKGDSDE